VRDHGDAHIVSRFGSLRRVRQAVAAVVVGGALAACSSAPAVEPSPSPTVTQTPTVTATATDNPYAIPDEITPEYVDLIANTIYGIWGDMIRELLAAPLDPGPLDPR
jgi:hypothetical protein